MLKVVCISDTHNLHRSIELPDGDVLIHAGDATIQGTDREAYDFINWFSEQSHPHKIFVPGNHDFYFEESHLYPPNIEVLNDRAMVIQGVKFYGTASQPPFCGWAFNHSDAKRALHYNNIDADTDVLITHCPPYGILDKEPSMKKSVGCEILQERIKQLNLSYHIFGHIHFCAGREGNAINACCVGEDYKLNKLPINTFEVGK